MSKWSDMYTRGLLFQWANTKNPIKGVGLVQGHHISGVIVSVIASSGVDRGLETGRITQTIKLVLVASPLSTQN